MNFALSRFVRRAAVLLAAASVAAVLAWPVREFLLRGQTDFVQLYTGAKLAGTGKLYDAEANYEWHQRLFGVRFPAVLHSRPAFYAVLLQPLGWLPYRTAFWLFVLLNVAAAAWVFRRILGPSPPAASFGAVYPATYLAILWGQDVWLAVALFCASVLLLRRGREAGAGLVMSLCSIKAHLFLLVPLVLLAHRRWRVLAGGAAGSAGLFLLCIAGDGPGWLTCYWKLLTGSAIHRDMGGMPNLQGVSVQLGSPAWFLPVAMLAVAAAVVWISARSRNIDAALAAALAGGYLLSYHAYPQDALTLLVAFALLPAAALRGLPAAAWWFLASPLPLGFALLGPPFHVVLPCAAAWALAVLAFSRRRPAPAADRPLCLSPGRPRPAGLLCETISSAAPVPAASAARFPSPVPALPFVAASPGETCSSSSGAAISPPASSFRFARSSRICSFLCLPA